jgi:hypothetical protein
MDRAIKFRPIRPYSPHLNGKSNARDERIVSGFYATVERSDPEMESKLKECSTSTTGYVHTARTAASRL